ncbi:hypothetical protein EV1_032069 [Malus domestica]
MPGPARPVSFNLGSGLVLSKMGPARPVPSPTTNMKRKIDQMQESDGQILLDHQRFVGLFKQHLPSSSGVVPRNEAPNDQPSVPSSSGVVPRNEAPNDQPSVPPPPGVPPSDEASHEQPS